MRARAQACASVSTVRMPLPHGSRCATEIVDQRARRLHRHDVEMEGLALDHAAERDHAVIGLLLLLGGIDRDGDGRHDFQRARHRDDVPGGLGLVEHLGGAGQQRVGDVVVEPRLDHEDARARGLRLFGLCWQVFVSVRP